MACRVVEFRSDTDAEPRGPAAKADDVATRPSTSQSGVGATRGSTRLASVDLVAAAAVIGAIDALSDREPVAPDITVTLSASDTDGPDLTEADFDQLLSVPVDPRSDLDIPAETDVFELDLEHLLALEVFGTNAPPADLTLLAFEDLVDVGVGTDDTETIEPAIDLTQIALETLQDIEFGDPQDNAVTPYRQHAALDVHSALDQVGINDVSLINRSAEPARSGGPDYVGEPPVAGQGARGSGTVPIATGANRPPTAPDDSLTTLQDSALSGKVLANVSDPVGDPLSVVTAGVTLNGTPSADRLVGTPGDDTLDGKGGDDVLIGLAGADILSGGTGIDTVSYENSAARIKISLESGTAFGGDAEGDVLTGIENVTGSAFDDLLVGDGDTNWLDGDAGNDTLDGALGDDTLRGGAGDDELRGGLGDDTVFGDAGEDTLNGGFGDDLLNGGPGTDSLFGDLGRDTFALEPGSGNDIDTIEDFVSGDDLLDLTAFGYASFSDISVASDGVGGSIITLSSGDSIALINLDPAALVPADVII